MNFAPLKRVDFRVEKEVKIGGEKKGEIRGKKEVKKDGILG